jgi:hypothetical protein
MEDYLLKLKDKIQVKYEGLPNIPVVHYSDTHWDAFYRAAITTACIRVAIYKEAYCGGADQAKDYTDWLRRKDPNHKVFFVTTNPTVFLELPVNQRWIFTTATPVTTPPERVNQDYYLEQEEEEDVEEIHDF